MKNLNELECSNVIGGRLSLIIKGGKWALKKLKKTSKSKTVASVAAISEVQSVRHSGYQK